MVPERFFEGLVRGGADAVVYADTQGLIRFWNGSATRLFGFSEQEALGASLDLIVPERLRARHWQGYTEVMAGRPSRYGAGDLLAVPARHQDGRQISVEFTILPFRDAAGALVGIAAVLRDVTARFEETRALRPRGGDVEGAAIKRMTTPRTIASADLDFAALIRKGDTVGWAQGTAEPIFLTRMLDAQAARCPPFRLFFAMTFAGDFAAAHPNVTVTATGGGGAGRRFFTAGAGNVIPANVSHLCELIAAGRPRIDIALLQVTGPDAAGNYNAGIGIECLREMMATARLVIAQLNPALPWTSGDTLIEPGPIDILVPAEHPPLELPVRTIGPVEQAIAAHAARLVPDRATIELGIGLIPEAVTRALGGKSGLGVHSGAIGDGVAELMQAGVIDNRHKEIDAGVTVTLMLMGSRRLYAYADRNPAVQIRSPRYTHDAVVLGNFRRFVAINSALEIDLTGQVNAETARGRHIGLVGGQMDFVRAAGRAPAGRSIIALPSMSRDRRHSRIVARLADGIVTTPRADADCVVTEHGIAELKGRTLAERARALIAIADPEFRADLERAAAQGLL